MRINDRNIRLLILACMVGTMLMLRPLIIQAFQPQGAIDAVQTEQIRALDMRVSSTERAIDDVNQNVNWILGGIAGMYALLGIIGMVNLKIIARKS